MITRRFQSDRPFGAVTGPNKEGKWRVHLPSANGQTGEYVGSILSEKDLWIIDSINIKDHDMRSLANLSFSNKEDCIIFLVEIFNQIQSTRNSSPIPDDIRQFIDVVARELEEEERRLRSAFSQHLYRSRWLSDLSKKYDLEDAYCRIDKDSARTVRGILDWTRKGDSHPFFSEETLSDIMDPEDVESLIYKIKEALREIDPFEVKRPKKEMETA